MKIVRTTRNRSLCISAKHFGLSIPNPTRAGAVWGFMLTIGPIILEACWGPYRTGTGRHWTWKPHGSIKRTASRERCT
jgi:hypothetical protein